MQSNIDNYIERLCRLVEHWSIDDEHHPPKLKDDIRSIGKALNRAGGVQLMRDAYYAAMTIQSRRMHD